MAEVTGLTAARMLEIEAACIVNGGVVLDDLILTRQDGTSFNAGSVRGPRGFPGIDGQDGQDAAPGSVDPTPDMTPIRTTDGNVKTANPLAEDDAANREYVDARNNGSLLINPTNLNDVTLAGTYHQAYNAEASVALNYPVALAGVLEVVSNAHFALSGSMVWQTYTPYREFGQAFYKRNYYSAVGVGWGPWVRFASNTDDVMRHKAFSGSSYTYNDTATYIRPTGDGGGSFVAPPSGIVTIMPTLYLKTTSASVYNYAGWQVNTGAVVGSGSMVRSDTSMIRTQSTTWLRVGGSSLCSGLTPGSTYNVFSVFASGTPPTRVEASQYTIVVIPSP